MSKKKQEKYRAIDLFAGIGGIRLGFERTFEDSIETVFVSEWDKYAQQTYRANFDTPVSSTKEECLEYTLDNGKNLENIRVKADSPVGATIYGDITEIDEKDIPPFDICLAGFPCQAFSIAGNKLGFEDDYKGTCRGTLFDDVRRICEYHKPKVIFCENVKGIVSHDKGRTIKVIKGAFRDIGYKVFDEVLNSKDFGVPQNRERWYMVAFRNDIAPEEFHFPNPTNPNTKIKDIKEENPVSVKYYLSTTYMDCLRKHKARHSARGNGFGFVIRDDNEYSGAVVCGGMGKERNLLFDDRLTDFTPVTHIKGEVNHEGIRRMTPNEWARLQGFPDNYVPLADVHAYKQYGNSVTVNVIKAIADNIKCVLDGKKISKKTGQILISDDSFNKEDDSENE